MFLEPGQKAPELRGITGWVNTNRETISGLKGKVVIVDFWTFSCINCIRTLPHIREWYNRYKDKGLVIIGVHTPEFPFEHKIENVQKAAKDFQLAYPIALDNDYATWNAYDNHYWPASYFIDRQGVIRHVHFGEGDYDENEKIIRALLEEGGEKLDMPVIEPGKTEVPVTPRQSPETYLGYARAANFCNDDEFEQDQTIHYHLSENISVNGWSLDGLWKMGAQNLESESDNARLKYRFAAREVYLVMGSSTGQPEQIEVQLNGNPVTEDNRGADVEPDGTVWVDEPRLYRLIKAESFTTDGELELVFPKGIVLNAFTFGS